MPSSGPVFTIGVEHVGLMVVFWVFRMSRFSVSVMWDSGMVWGILGWVVFKVSGFSFDAMADFVEFKKGSSEVFVTVLGASHVSGFVRFEFGKEFKAFSISVICTLNRFGLNGISVFVGTVSGIIACITTAVGSMVLIDSGCGCISFAIGGDGCMKGDGVVRWGHGGAKGFVVLVWTTCDGCTLVMVAHSHGLYCCSSLFKVSPLSDHSLQSLLS